MPKSVAEIPSPAVLIDVDAMDRNIQRVQSACDAAGVELWPHIKTHKLVPVLRRQLEAGAKGATCAKIGEAEALLPSGVRRVFIAHSLADLAKAPRLKKLSEQLDQLILAVTSELQCDVLEKILEAADIKVSVLMAVDTGLNREGARTHEQAASLANKIRQSSRMELLGIYTHEGHAYFVSGNDAVQSVVPDVHAKLKGFQEAVGDVELWPGCSVTAEIMARQPGVKVVRPGSYVFGDLSLTARAQIMPHEDAALTILTTVVDRPDDTMALLDAGTKVFSSDKTAEGVVGVVQDQPGLHILRLSEEHGFLSGEGVNTLPLGTRLRVQPAHVCPVMNLASKVYAVRGDEVVDVWSVDARGRSD